LKEAKFIVVQELFLTDTARLADVVLPAQAYTERDGSFTSGERRVQRFYPALPPRGESRADFAITAALAKELGIELEGHSAARVMDRLAASTQAYERLSYRRLAEVTEQWPLVGRGDLYYGGTTYENKQGLGVQLEPMALRSISSPAGGSSLRPDEDRWLAVPVTRLYDLGITVRTSELLRQRIDAAVILLNPEMAKTLEVDAGGQVELNGNRLEARLDASVPASVVLVPRSMGIPIHTPVAAKLKKV
jgi:NADH-quinone oxidoreductase subunit G